MRLWKKKKLKTRKKESNIYRSSDTCPADRYEKASIDKRFLYVVWSDELNNELIEAWENINDELMDEFGVDPTIQTLLLAEKRYIELNTEYILTGKRRLITDIDMARLRYEKLKAESKKETGSSFTKIAAKLLLVHKIRVDIKEVTIKEFRHIIIEAQNGTTV